MIPKIIHYCWFGGNPLPDLAKKCIASWKKYLPEYEINEWNESNFDIESCAYVKEAYEEKKWAFVSDYARFYILYHYGGLYFDTDVELINSIDDILKHGSFMGAEGNYSGINSGLGLGCEAGNPIFAEILQRYKKRHFRLAEGVIDQLDVVKYVTEIFQEYGYKPENGLQVISGITVYPKDYFSPMDYSTGQITITENTRSIHHYTASWKSEKDLKWEKFNRKVHNTLNRRTADKMMASIPMRLIGSVYRNGLKTTLRAIKSRSARKKN